MKIVVKLLVAAVLGCWCFAASALELRYGPWLSHPDSGTVTVNFVSDRVAGGAVDFRVTGAADWERVYGVFAGQIVTDRNEHRIRLEGTPGAEYEYRAVLIDPADRSRETVSDIRRFRLTGPEQTSYRFYVTSDLQYKPERERELLDKFAKAAGFETCDFGIPLGDMSHRTASIEKDVLHAWIEPLAIAGAGSVPLAPVRGNHEWRGAASSAWMRLMGHPGRQSAYYAFSFGPDFFIVLDSGEDKPDRHPGHSYTDFNVSKPYRAEQRRWLTGVVASPEFRRARFRVVLTHCGTYGNGNGWNVEYVREMTRGLLDGTGAENRIHLMLVGHSHRYLRGFAGQDTLAVWRPNEKIRTTSMSSGKNFSYSLLMQDGPGGAGGDASASRIEVTPAGIEVKSFVEDGTMIDHFRLSADGRAEELITLEKFVPYDSRSGRQ